MNVKNMNIWKGEGSVASEGFVTAEQIRKQYAQRHAEVAQRREAEREFWRQREIKFERERRECERDSRIKKERRKQKSCQEYYTSSVTIDTGFSMTTIYEAYYESKEQW